MLPMFILYVADQERSRAFYASVLGWQSRFRWILRPGNAGSNTAADHVTVLEQALESLAAAYRLKEEYGKYHGGMSLAVFDGKFSDTFTAMGDDYGLLIIPVLGREWFPETGVNAHLLPVKVVLSNHVNQLFSVSGPPYEIEEL